MTSRERVMLALNFEEPDRVPIDFWATPGFYRLVEKSTRASKEEFLEKGEVDFRYVEGPRYVGPALPAGQGGSYRDLWGVERTIVSVRVGEGEEQYSEVASSPLAAASTPEEADSYAHWPSADWFDYSVLRSQCERVRKAGFAVVFMGDRLNRVAQLKPAMYIRGVDTILMDMAVKPEMADVVFGRVRSFYCEYLGRILEAAGGLIDIVLTGDDFGAQNAPLISVPMWTRFLQPGFSSYVSIIKESGARCMHHTCGNVVPLVGAMVGCGLDVLQSLQPECMEGHFRELKRTYGDRLSFHGGISVQRTLPNGSPEDIRREVRKRTEELAPGGGYVYCTAHNVQADCPIENVEAMIEAYGRFGRY